MTFKTTTLTAALALGLGAGAGVAQDTAPAATTPAPAASAPSPSVAATPAPGQTPSNEASAPSAAQQPVPVPGAAGEPPIAGGTVPGTPAASDAVTGTADPAAGTLVNAPSVGSAEVATPRADTPAPAAPAQPVAAPAPAAPAAPAPAAPAPAAPAPAPIENAAPAAADAPAAPAPTPAAGAPTDGAAPAAPAEAAAPATEAAPAEGAAAPAPAAAPAAAPAEGAAPAAPAHEPEHEAAAGAHGAHHQQITDVGFSFEGPFGKFDQFQLQRGLQVYTEVCAACHGMRYVPIRTLADPGGPGLPEDQVRAYAATMDIDDPETGETRPRLPTDHFPHNTGAGAPDLSVMAKGRAGFHGPYGTGVNQLVKGIGGPEYIYSILTHYTGKTKEEAGETFYENTAFDGGWIKMPPPLADDQVTFEDGHPATVANEAQDVSAFLMWAAEPKMMARKQVGLVSVIFLLTLTVLLYLTNKRLWWGIKHPTTRRVVDAAPTEVRVQPVHDARTTTTVTRH